MLGLIKMIPSILTTVLEDAILSSIRVTELGSDQAIWIRDLVTIGPSDRLFTRSRLGFWLLCLVVRNSLNLVKESMVLCLFCRGSSRLVIGIVLFGVLFLLLCFQRTIRVVLGQWRSRNKPI